MAFRAVVLDFDGVILETEEPAYLAWKQVWQAYGQTFSLETWAGCIGTDQDGSTFDPFAELVARTGLSLVEADVRAQAQQLSAKLLGAAGPQEGLVDWLEEARALGMGLAIASSSPSDWVQGHLTRLGLAGYFEALACSDDSGAAKPDPAPYLLACQLLGVAPYEALAVEDSHNGLVAAKAAGLCCIVVPTKMTKHMDFTGADLVVGSLRSMSLRKAAELLASVPG